MSRGTENLAFDVLGIAARDLELEGRHLPHVREQGACDGFVRGDGLVPLYDILRAGRSHAQEEGVAGQEGREVLTDQRSYSRPFHLSVLPDDPPDDEVELRPRHPEEAGW